MTATIKTISIEVLAEKLNGKLWVKDTMKRIYLDCGYNTKKMSTKTYVYQRENGSFGVSCYIDCPSQPYAWIKSQQDEVIEDVNNRIEYIIKKDAWEKENPNGNYDEAMENIAIENEKAIALKEFEESKESSLKNDYEYYNRCKKLVNERDEKIAEFENMDEQTKKRVEELNAERVAILGTPGSAKRSKEIKNELESLPSIPCELQSWVVECASFSSEQEYHEFKQAKRLDEINKIGNNG